jgi:large subunit ribosomal protein L10
LEVYVLTRSEKEQIVADLRAELLKAQAVFVTNLVGIPSNDAVRIRKDIRDAGGKVVITRNTLLEMAAVGTAAESAVKGLKGPNALALAFTDAAAIAKVIKTAGAQFEVVDFKGGVLDGKDLSVKEIRALADLPSRDQMLGTLLATFIAPVSAFARVLHAIKEKKEQEAVA